MSRFYVPKENVRKDEITIEGEEAHHVLDVMRMQGGDKVVVFDGTGREYTGFIKEINRRFKKIIVEIVRTEKPPAESIPEITLAQAIPKKGKMDYIIEKATELGVSRVVPLVSDRTVVRFDDAGCRRKVQRWQKKAVEASKQCGRASVPKIDKVTSFSEMVSRLDRYDLVLLACLTDKTVPIKKSLTGFESGKILVFIGPEGDFTPKEIQMASVDNCKQVSLGKRVLKSDTAGLFVLAVLGYEFAI
ncbi:MAG: 16S rRNA (uracil(1498)-N(3))-methyltransferase [Candidatus Omnitrophota bacterium]